MVSEEVREAILKMKTGEFSIFFRLLMQELEVSRHASCELQTLLILTADPILFDVVLSKMPKEKVHE